MASSTTTRRRRKHQHADAVETQHAEHDGGDVLWSEEEEEATVGRLDPFLSPPSTTHAAKELLDDNMTMHSDIISVETTKQNKISIEVPQESPSPPALALLSSPESSPDFQVSPRRKKPSLLVSPPNKHHHQQKRAIPQPQEDAVVVSATTPSPRRRRRPPVLDRPTTSSTTAARQQRRHHSAKDTQKDHHGCCSSSTGSRTHPPRRSVSTPYSPTKTKSSPKEEKRRSSSHRSSTTASGCSNSTRNQCQHRPQDRAFRRTNSTKIVTMEESDPAGNSSSDQDKNHRGASIPPPPPDGSPSMIPKSPSILPKSPSIPRPSTPVPSRGRLRKTASSSFPLTKKKDSSATSSRTRLLQAPPRDTPQGSRKRLVTPSPQGRGPALLQKRHENVSCDGGEGSTTSTHRIHKPIPISLDQAYGGGTPTRSTSSSKRLVPSSDRRPASFSWYRNSSSGSKSKGTTSHHPRRSVAEV